MHKRAVFNFGEFKSCKCYGISFSRNYTSQGQKKQKILENQGFSWLYLFYSPYLVAEGFFIAPSAFVSSPIASIHSTRPTRNARHRFGKNAYQPFCASLSHSLRPEGHRRANHFVAKEKHIAAMTMCFFFGCGDGI